MATPPFGVIAAITKHGSDEDVVRLRNDIRWLAIWASEVHNEIVSIWKRSDISVTPACWDEECDAEVREVNLRLRLTEQEIQTLLDLINHQQDES